jgi:hypothetical protein
MKRIFILVSMLIFPIVAHAQTASIPPAKPTCPDKICDDNEKQNKSLCPEDCTPEKIMQQTMSRLRCGNDVCEDDEREQKSCPKDCDPKTER